MLWEISSPLDSSSRDLVKGPIFKTFEKGLEVGDLHLGDQSKGHFEEAGGQHVFLLWKFHLSFL